MLVVNDMERFWIHVSKAAQKNKEGGSLWRARSLHSKCRKCCRTDQTDVNDYWRKKPFSLQKRRIEINYEKPTLETTGKVLVDFSEIRL